MTTTANTARHGLENSELHDFYDKRGFSGRVGCGERPAVVVIDLARAWTVPYPASPLGSDLSGVIDQTNRILEVARAIPIPIFFTTMEFDPDGSDIGSVVARKTPHLWTLARGSEWTALDPRLNRLPGEVLIPKQRASAFFGTSLLSQLIAHNVDTLIVTGCSTSGCVRATAQTGFDNNFHVVVPREAVGDRSPSAHEANLFDIDARMGDVLATDDVLAYLARIRDGALAIR